MNTKSSLAQALADVTYAAQQFAMVCQDNNESKIEGKTFDLDECADEAAEEYAEAYGHEYPDGFDVDGEYITAFFEYVENTSWYEDYLNSIEADEDDNSDDE